MKQRTHKKKGAKEYLQEKDWVRYLQVTKKESFLPICIHRLWSSSFFHLRANDFYTSSWMLHTSTPNGVDFIDQFQKENFSPNLDDKDYDGDDSANDERSGAD